jgi:hypothetical protein
MANARSNDDAADGLKLAGMRNAEADVDEAERERQKSYCFLCSSL